MGMTGEVGLFHDCNLLISIHSQSVSIYKHLIHHQEASRLRPPPVLWQLAVLTAIVPFLQGDETAGPWVPQLANICWVDVVQRGPIRTGVGR